MKSIILSIVLLGYAFPLYSQNGKYFDKDYWRKQALEDVLPYWSMKAVDSSNGMFFTNLDRNWNQFGSFDQSPSMIARHLFAFSSGYLMSGDDKLLQRAKELLDYLEKNAWDNQNGGWYDLLDRSGKPVKVTKTTFNQVYCITGLTLYYFVTKDATVLKRIEEANHLLETHTWDPKNGGYYDVMNRDWTVRSDTKSFSSEITPVSGYLFYLYLATREERYLEQIRKIMEVVSEKMIDPATGWVLESFNHNWQYIYPSGGLHEINIGHNIETAWMFLRLYRIVKDDSYLEEAKKLSRLIDRYGFNDSNGCWYANVSKTRPEQHPDLAYWWIQAYGNMYQLLWYSLDKQQERLDVYEKGTKFWDRYFIDRKDGDAFQGVSVNGEPTDPVKANLFKASYHNLENSLLNWLYLGLWVKPERMTLYFDIVPGIETSLNPLPVEETNHRIVSVKINGRKIRVTDRHCVTVPKTGGRVEVVVTN